TGLDFSWYSVDHRFVDYTIETSLDGSTWNTVATVVGNTSASYTDSFAPVEAAHVRIRSTLWTGGATWGPALREVAFR
ncbi:MAG: discoidin domain-containing protein, partial [Roseovarius sp.]|nr:discoidin domain-containing protein [Roseovarius sp.]